MKKITNPDEAYQWIIKNKDKMSRSVLINALDRWGIMAGFTMMTGEDFLWCLENIEPSEKNEK